MTPKIATCCYCGTRAALSLRRVVRHELACSNCGAPLHEMKMLRADASGERELVRSGYSRGERTGNRKRRPQKKTKSLSQRFMEEFWDAAEDIFDDMFD